MFCVFVTVTAVDVVLLSIEELWVHGRRPLLLMKPHNKMIITTTMKMIRTVTPVTIETAAAPLETDAA